MTQLPSDPPTTINTSPAKPQMPNFRLYYYFQPLVLATVFMFFIEFRGGSPFQFQVIIVYIFFIFWHFVFSLFGLPLWYLVYRIMARSFSADSGPPAIFIRWIAYCGLGVLPVIVTHTPFFILGMKYEISIITFAVISSVVGGTIIIVFEIIALVRFKIDRKKCKCQDNSPLPHSPCQKEGDKKNLSKWFFSWSDQLFSS